jgi:predicted aldo/keto reductase-like oxidoreductase
MVRFNLTRRNFLKAAIASTIMGPLAALDGCSPKNEYSAPSAGQGLGFAAPSVDVVNGMPYRLLGKTGAKVSLLGVGGFHIGKGSSPQEAIALIRTALDEGVNFLDNAWEYHSGQSEERMGKALREGYREKAFLMTKVCARDEKGAMENLEDSLRRLNTDVIDLWQFHEIDSDIDSDMIFAKDGAIHAAIKAREQGKVRFIGFTGHKSPRVHLKMLRQDFPWDAVQMPINIMDAHYRSFARQVLPILVQRKIGVVAMKTASFGDILRGGPRHRLEWMRTDLMKIAPPLGDILRGYKVSVAECLHFAMGLPVSVVVSGMDNLEMAKENIAIAKTFKPMTEGERSELLARVRDVARGGRLERFKSTHDFDSRIHMAQRHLD